MNNFKINISNYSGPLETLLDLAKSQKVNLAEISITNLADQFLEFIKKAEKLNLDLASEYLLMATWLTYLKSKLLLPENEEEEFKASEVAEKLKIQLKKLELIRILSDQLLKRKKMGYDIFFRGSKNRTRSSSNSIYSVKLYDVLKSYSETVMKKEFLRISIPKLPVFTAEEAIKKITSSFEILKDWKNLFDLIPLQFKKNRKFHRSGIAGIFAGSLELSKEGKLALKQEDLFEKIYIKKRP